MLTHRRAGRRRGRTGRNKNKQKHRRRRSSPSPEGGCVQCPAEDTWKVRHLILFSQTPSETAKSRPPFLHERAEVQSRELPGVPRQQVGLKSDNSYVTPRLSSATTTNDKASTAAAAVPGVPTGLQRQGDGTSATPDAACCSGARFGAAWAARVGRSAGGRSKGADRQHCLPRRAFPSLGLLTQDSRPGLPALTAWSRDTPSSPEGPALPYYKCQMPVFF